MPIDEPAPSRENSTADRPAAPAAPDCSTIVANLDRQSAPAWPTATPFTVDWPWAAECDPVPGDLVGWNWQRGEIAVVTAVPPVTAPWPYTLTVEIRPMPEQQRHVKVFDLNSGRKRSWTGTRVGTDSQISCTPTPVPASPVATRSDVASGWLAVVQEGKGA